MVTLRFLGLPRVLINSRSLLSQARFQIHKIWDFLGGDFMPAGRVVLHLSVMIIVTKSLFSAPDLSETMSQIKSIPGWAGAI